MVVDRRHASDVEQGFSRDPEEVASHSYVNMYMHHDGMILQCRVSRRNTIYADTSLSKNRRADWRRDMCQEFFPI